MQLAKNEEGRGSGRLTPVRCSATRDALWSSGARSLPPEIVCARSVAHRTWNYCQLFSAFFVVFCVNTPRGEAASIVAGWLGNAAYAEDDVPLPEFNPRPERLGLGAKYVPHSGALSVQEKSFGRKLQPKKEKAESSAAFDPPLKMTQKGKKGRAQQKEPDDDSDEEEGNDGEDGFMIKLRKAKVAMRSTVRWQRRKAQASEDGSDHEEEDG